MQNDIINRMSEFDLDKPIEIIIFDSDDEETKLEKQYTIISLDTNTESTSKTVQENSLATKSPKPLIPFELNTDIINKSVLNELNSNIKEVLKDLPVLVEEDETSPYFSEIKKTKRISLPDSNKHENNAPKRICLNKDQDVTTKLSTNNNDNHIPKNSLTNSSNSVTQNGQSYNSRSIMKETVKGLAEDLLRTCDILQRNGFNTVNDIWTLDFRHIICDSIITTIEAILSPIEKYEEFSIKLVDYALVRCEHKYSHFYLMQLFNRIVQWVKGEKSKNNTINGLISDTQASIKTSHSKLTSLNKLTSNTNNTCLYSNGPPGREINISVDAALLKKVTAPNSDNITSTNVRNSTSPVMADKYNTNVQSKTVTLNNLKNNSMSQPLLDEITQKTCVETNTILNNNSVLKEMLKGPNPRTNVEQIQRSYQHPTYDSIMAQYLLPAREPQVIKNFTQNLTSTHPTLNQQLTQPNYVVPTMPQNFSQLQLPYNVANWKQNPHQQYNYMTPNHTPEYNRFSTPPYQSAMTVPPITRQPPQLREAQEDFTSQRTHPPPPPYNQNEYQREPYLAYQVQHKQSIHYQKAGNSTYHQRSDRPYSSPQAQHDISNMLYPPPNYPVQRQVYNQSVPPTAPAPPPFFNHTKAQNTNNQMQSLQISSDYRHKLSHQESHNRNRLSHRESARSTSTDSGFISPLNFNTSTEQPTAIVEEELNPIITHVTSLNPGAVYIEDGPCSVCSTPTKTKCIDCLNCYYCSIECQQRDWEYHQSICKSGTLSE